MSERWSIGQCAKIACLLEVTAPKVGNVHRGADFEDLTYNDFLMSAMAIERAMDRASETGVGATCKAAIEATREIVSTNTNLGIVLLLAPLAAVPVSQPLRTGVRNVLDQLTPQDSAGVYEAIRMANPGGLGKAKQMDITESVAPPSLLEAMRAASDRDLIARQYIDGFQLVFDSLAEWIADDLARNVRLTDAIVHAQVRCIAQESDSLIARKCGPAIAEQTRDFARAVLRFGGPGHDEYYQALGDFDFWLRADGHRRNPGTTADLIAAALFVLLRDQRLANRHLAT